VTTADNLRKAAKRWLKSIRAGDLEARARLNRAYPAAPDAPTLRDVQHALARERGFESWIALTRAALEEGASETPLTALLLAAGKGDAARVATILDEHPEIIDERGTLPGNIGLRTALHFGSGHEPVVRTLLERGASPNIRDEGDNAFPLHFAAERGDLAIVTLLVEHGADPIGADTTHELDVLGWAVCFDYATNLDVARYLLAHGARHTLLSAVAMGDAGAIRMRAAAGDDLSQRMDRTNHRRTPLHLAVVKKQAASLAVLIELGADLNLPDAVGLTPLDQAALDGEEEMTRLLLAAGATINPPAAIALERTDDLERLLRDDPELFSTTDNRRWASLLVHASRRAPGPVLEKLLRTLTRHRAGLSLVNMEDNQETAFDGASGVTPLHAAAFSGNDAAVEVLLKHGANPRARDGRYCGTPAGWADYAGHMEAANRILEEDIDIFDAIAFDRADRVSDILDRDPEALGRPFRAYASCESKEGQWWPAPDATPLEWATARQKLNAIRVLAERGAAARTLDDARRTERVVNFLQWACWDEHVHGKRDHRMCDRAAARVLEQDPWIARENLYTAIVCGNIDEVSRILADRPEAARQRGGSRGWTPILYLAYTRFSHPRVIEHTLAIARLLLDRGADPSDFYMAGDARYSVLTGVAGEGEQDAPRQPYAPQLFDLLLERGAEPFDIQVLYNTHFSGDMRWWLELVYKHTIDTPRGAAWKDADWTMLDMGCYGSGARFVLEAAVKTRNLPLAEWALAHGANPHAVPARDRRFPKHSLYEFALMEGLPEMADLLARYGGSPTSSALDEQERFLAACFRLDRDEARRLLAAHPAGRSSPVPMCAAARRDRPDVLALLLDLGFDIDVRDATGKTPLHEAAASGALGAAAFLIEHGAEVDAHESTYNAAPIGWASHGDKTDMVRLLSRYSREVPTLCYAGYVDRVRELLADDPQRARVASRDGHTPFWWLPDDEAAALELVDLLITAGVDPATTNTEGKTAADWARRRGMLAVAARLDRAAAHRS
jgi:ankyrin repeat protein